MLSLSHTASVNLFNGPLKRLLCTTYAWNSTLCTIHNKSKSNWFVIKWLMYLFFLDFWKTSSKLWTVICAMISLHCGAFSAICFLFFRPANLVMDYMNCNKHLSPLGVTRGQNLFPEIYSEQVCSIMDQVSTGCFNVSSLADVTDPETERNIWLVSSYLTCIFG